MKIDKLTREQQKQLSVYSDKYLKIGLSTERVDKSLAIESANEIITKILGRKRVPVVILDNPVHCWIAVCMFSVSRDQVEIQGCDQVYGQVRDQVEHQVFDQAWDQVRNQLRDKACSQVEDKVCSQVENKVWSQVEDKVRSQVEDKVRDKAWSQVEDKVRDKVWSQVEDQVWDKVWSQAWDQVRDHVDRMALPNFVMPYIDGNLWASFFSFYDYMAEVLKIDLVEKYSVFKKSLNLSLLYPLENICIACDRPTEIHMENGKLHNPEGPSVKYNGGFEVYSLGGVGMTGCEWVITEANPEPEKILAIKNAEQRLQAIKHVGLDKFIDALGYEVIDKKDEYELLLLNVEGRKCEYLKMVNPSSGEIHVEGVKPGIKTVTEAMAWRMGLQVFSNPLAKA